MSAPANTANLLHDLEPIVEQNLERHLKIAKEWHPHDYIPWDEGRNFAFMGGQDVCAESQRGVR